MGMFLVFIVCPTLYWTNFLTYHLTTEVLKFLIRDHSQKHKLNSYNEIIYVITQRALLKINKGH